ncbi:lipopolysaccharide biosynthesis protein [Marinobacterium sp. xm-a-152]|uniref:lipopolysaccharide biosynthesis protein n=1 Tax=Marinobacterium sp. xm-a-152 TaxID=2497733 RepID=UPI001569D282|nr:oligosaccharide flippase family protein [Marinobacterium sp. xm-a-152]NRP15028.1 colanic acid exporter [Marinobacterium sp. xm-a-152]
MSVLGNKFAKNVGVLVGGASASQLLLILASPVLTRLYTPEDFGVLSVYMAIISIFVVIAGLRYELAIALPENEEQAINLVVLAQIMVVVVSVATAISLAIYGQRLVGFLKVPEIHSYIWLIPIGILFIGTYQVFNYWAIRKKEFRRITKTRIMQSIITVIVQFSAFKLSGFGLVIGQACGQSVGVWSLSKEFIKNRVYLRATKDGILKCASRYRDFPLFSTWGGLANVAGAQLPPILFAAYYTPGIVGLYALAYRVMGAPMTFVGQAIGSVFLSDAPDRYRKNTLVPFLLGVHKRLVYLILVPVLILVGLGPDIFSLVFGEAWRVAGEAARWLSLWMMMAFTTSPFSSIYEVAECQRLGMFMQFQLLIARCIGVVIGATFGDFMFAIVCFSISNVISYAIYLCVLFRVIGGDPLKIAANYIFPFLAISLLFWVVYFESFN